MLQLLTLGLCNSQDLSFLLSWGVPQSLPYIFLIAYLPWLKQQPNLSGLLFMILTSLFINVLSLGQSMRLLLMLFLPALQTPVQELWLSPVPSPMLVIG
jgi:hypothetical protein